MNFELIKKHGSKKDKFLYGDLGKSVQELPRELTELNNPDPIPVNGDINIFGFTYNRKLKSKRAGKQKMLWGDKEVKKFIKENITENFNSEAEQREARDFTIAVLLKADCIDYNTVSKLMVDSDDCVYLNSVYNTLMGGVTLFGSYELVSFEKVCDMDVVNKTIQLLKNCMPDSVIRSVEHSLEKFNGFEAIHNDKDLPAIVSAQDAGILTTNVNMPRNDWYEFEKEFGGILDGFNHTFYYAQDETPVLRLLDPRGLVPPTDIRIDTGEITGIGKAIEIPVFAYGRLDTIFCNIKRHPDIVRWFLSNPQNTISEEQLKEIQKDFFQNRIIYYYFDFGTPTAFAKLYPIIGNLNEKDFRAFEANLMKILNLGWNYNVRMPRVRFQEFRNINDFVIVSDSKVKTNNITDCCKEILPGLSITFKDGIITTDYEGSPLDFSEVANGSQFGGPIFGGLYI